jgi:hypothetical protein
MCLIYIHNTKELNKTTLTIIALAAIATAMIGSVTATSYGITQHAFAATKSFCSSVGGSAAPTLFSK